MFKGGCKTKIELVYHNLPNFYPGVSCLNFKCICVYIIINYMLLDNLLDK